MQFARLNRKLEGISHASRKGRPVKDLLKTMVNCRELWIEAYANIYSNKGAITKGVNENTLDGFSWKRVDKIIEKLRNKKYRFAPAKRIYIPKSNGKKRPLGILTGDDKLVMEVARILLERVYDPIFSDKSHGFRPHRSCHTALEHIQKYWTGVKWFLEFDIREFFSSMDHEIMIQLLGKRIEDRRFIGLIRCMLKAGYLEDWSYHSTYSGTPQGAGASPILSNIYLHSLDTFMEDLIGQFNKGKRRRYSLEYKRLSEKKRNIRKKIDQNGKDSNLVSEFKRLDRIQKSIPSLDPHDDGYKRLVYCRYCDDFVAGVIGSREEAQEIMGTVGTFLERELKLQIADEKTGIQKGKEGMEFLSYRIRTQRTPKIIRIKINGIHLRRRSITGIIRLEVPWRKVQIFCQKYRYGDWQQLKAFHRPELTVLSDVDIIQTYNAGLRGLSNYYALASDVKTKLQKLMYLAHYSLYKTLASKHQTRVTAILARLKHGNEHVHQYEIKGEQREVIVFKLRHMATKPRTWELDSIPMSFRLTSLNSELVRRLNQESCEYCKCTELPLESHHIKKLKDLRQKPHLQMWKQVMIARRRKTLILCVECHDLLHAGRLPDSRCRV